MGIVTARTSSLNLVVLGCGSGEEEGLVDCGLLDPSGDTWEGAVAASAWTSVLAWVAICSELWEEASTTGDLALWSRGEALGWEPWVTWGGSPGVPVLLERPLVPVDLAVGVLGDLAVFPTLCALAFCLCVVPM